MYYLAKVKGGETSFIPTTSYLTRNFIINNHHSTLPIDHDYGIQATACYGSYNFEFLELYTLATPRLPCIISRCLSLCANCGGGYAWSISELSLLGSKQCFYPGPLGEGTPPPICSICMCILYKAYHASNSYMYPL